MGANNIQRISPPNLVIFSNSMATAIGAGVTPPYGITAAQRTALTVAATDLAAANAALENAKTAHRAAVQDRETKERTCANAAAAIARVVYISAATPAQIAALGLSPRSTTKTKVVPKTPATLSATLLPDGGVTLAWGRSGNPTGVVFRIEASVADGPWTFADETTTSKIVLDGFAPGVSATFRVTASKNGELSSASPVATIYPAPAAPFLRLAA